MARILLIDDSKLARNLLRNMLESDGYTICGEVLNGKIGLQQYKKLKPDLVFCDMMMNVMNGVEFLQATLAEYPDAKIVICTSVSDELHVKESLTAGAIAFVKKPLETAEVLRVTRQILGKQRPNPNQTYKQLMEERAAARGITGKPLLDFFDAFRQFNGFAFDDPKVDEMFLNENATRIVIGARALMSAKMPTSQAEPLMDIFQGLTS